MSKIDMDALVQALRELKEEILLKEKIHQREMQYLLEKLEELEAVARGEPASTTVSTLSRYQSMTSFLSESKKLSPLLAENDHQNFSLNRSRPLVLENIFKSEKLINDEKHPPKKIPDCRVNSGANFDIMRSIFHEKFKKQVVEQTCSEVRQIIIDKLHANTNGTEKRFDVKELHFTPHKRKLSSSFQNSEYRSKSNRRNIINNSSRDFYKSASKLSYTPSFYYFNM